ncbi:MAG: transcriptional regulator, partial [Actinomycetes bacterium]
MREPDHALRAARERMPSRLAPGEPMTRAELADAVNAWLWKETDRRFDLDDHLIGKWERGVVRQPIRQYRVALRAVLGVDTDTELGFRAPDRLSVVTATALADGGPRHSVDPRDDAQALGDTDEVKRRELLRLFSMTGAMLALPPEIVDTERMQAVVSGVSRPDAAVVGDFARLNEHLWNVYGLAAQKRSTLPLARDQLAALTESLHRADPRDRRHLCQLVSDAYQLLGEVFFDADQYADAAQCYLLAGAAAHEAREHDLWATALTRHAFISVYEQQFDKAVPMLDLASRIAHRGDPDKATRYWVAAVRAEATAGTGDNRACERDLDTAARVVDLSAPPQNVGWLRFDGSRLPEQRGTCMISLGELDAAETALTEALSHASTARRRASVLTDLASVSARRGDHHSVAVRLDEAITAAH